MKKIDYLKAAAQKARHGVAHEWGGPFGAALVRNGKLIALTCNTVLKNNDATCHAEINAIRLASKKLKRLFLDSCVMYSTTEPCPMCFAAIHWARIKKVVYSTTIADVRRLGFNELSVSNNWMKKKGGSHVQVQRISDQDCKELLKFWSKMTKKRTY